MVLYTALKLEEELSRQRDFYTNVWISSRIDRNILYTINLNNWRTEKQAQYILWESETYK